MYTLNLFKSSFELNPAHADREAYRNRWASDEVTKELHREAAGRPLFLLHDGPPYANGNLHMGHVVNKTLKDAVLKYKRLQGNFAPFVPGFDCHGLPVELEVEKLGVSKADPVAFVAACRSYALSQVAMQAGEFQDVGVAADWTQPYLTLAPEFEAGAGQLFAAMPQAVKRLRPVHWCAQCGSSLAEAEVEYKPKSSDSLEVLFEVADVPNMYLVVWTTTPYTLPANKAVAFASSLEYVSVQVGERHLVRARREGDPADLPVVQLEGMAVVSPYTKQVVPVLAADYVTAAGTGLVHLAPSFGMDDFRVGERYGLPVDAYVDDHGRFLSGALEGQTLKQASSAVLETVADLVHSHTQAPHEYPHCWRHKTPVFFKASEQWFLDLAEVGPHALTALADVTFVPAAGRERLAGMLTARTSWCVSRNRLWGSPLVDPRNPDEVAALAAVETQGLAAWHQDGPRMTLDVWFDSGVTHQLVMRKRFGRTADVYLEGSDQHRGWFQSSLLTAAALGSPAPFKTLVTHGFVVDEHGRKYSKSSKNYVPVADLLRQHSPDVLRLWALSQDFTRDLKFSKESMARTVERYRKLRNTMRFCLQNLVDYPCERVPTQVQDPLAQLALAELSVLAEEVLGHAESYDFAAGLTALAQYAESVSSGYFMSAKDVLYCDAPASSARRESQFVLSQVVRVLLRLLTPVMPFTAEDVFDVLKGYGLEEGASAVLLTMSDLTLSETAASRALLHTSVALGPLKQQVNQYVEAHRSDGVKSAAALEMVVDQRQLPAWCSADVTALYLGVARVHANSDKETGFLSRTTMKLCPRCRRHHATVLAGLCARCEPLEPTVEV